MIGALMAVLAIVAIGGRATDGLRRAEAESILARLPRAEAVAYYDVLRRRMRRIVIMRALALLSLMWILFVFRQRLIQHEAPPPTVAGAPTEPKPPRWRGDFETGNLSQWSFLLNPRGLSVVEAPVAKGRHAARVEIQPGDLWPNGLNRVELEHKPPQATVAEGQRSCFAWRFFLPVPLSEARHQIGYWESYPSYTQIMSFEVRGRAIAFVTRLPAERVHWSAPDAVTPGIWHQIAMCTRWSVDPAVGTVDVWFDAKKVVDRGPARTLWDNPNFVHIGLLRDVPAGPEVMFLDDALEAAELDPAR